MKQAQNGPFAKSIFLARALQRCPGEVLKSTNKKATAERIQQWLQKGKSNKFPIGDLFSSLKALSIIRRISSNGFGLDRNRRHCASGGYYDICRKCTQDLLK